MASFAIITFTKLIHWLPVVSDALLSSSEFLSLTLVEI